MQRFQHAEKWNKANALSNDDAIDEHCCFDVFLCHGCVKQRFFDHA
ncbi:hypothetical protein MTBPR1_110065 [Candidatus Terasakiella magnetica]|uniref:Uncharacterized protein n=1 Tax=Candidatus Terasakiella magnetica TaxID=1867952 RepID=A0A1C3REA4_9PROT|nr:hypothetical protein MTBPR1_110065 [Candidatus Terasakiella magnetica]